MKFLALLLAIPGLSPGIAWGDSGNFGAINMGSGGDSGLSSSGLSQPSSLGAFHLVIQPEASLSGNAPALAAFQRAAGTWESYISDPITVVISANVGSFGSGNESIIGGTSSYLFSGDYGTIRNSLVADAAGEANDAIVSSLPLTSTGLAVRSLTGVSFSGNVTLTKANAKALGFTGLDAMVGTSVDSYIDFNSDFAFDYDRSDGISPGMIDFESVALHEIGHALGFISQVDVADAMAGYDAGVPYILAENGDHIPIGQLDPSTLDLFRVVAGSTDFTNAVREMTPGNAADFYDGQIALAMSTGVARGDGRQASHWKDDGLTGYQIGAMDPTIDYGRIFNLSSGDLRAMDLIGYDIVPEPSVWMAACLGVIGMMLGRRRA